MGYATNAITNKTSIDTVFWYLIFAIDAIFFLPCICTVVYMLLFSLASMRSSIIHPVAKGRSARFLVIISAYCADDTVIDTIESIIAQDYREQDYDIFVVSSCNKPVTNLKLKQYRLSLVTTDKTTRGAMLQSAISQSNSLKLYDMAVVLDAGDTVDRDFLSWLNRSRQDGSKIIQAHRMSRLRETALEAMEATFEEINNSVFRRGHIAVGLSSGLATSGTAYDYSWFKTNVPHLEEGIKEAEARIMSERILIDYVDEAHVYSLKSRTGGDFGTTRDKWRTAQKRILRRNLRFLIPALLTHRYDYADKIIQWVLVPRTWLVTICCLFSFLWPCIYWTIAIKWWAALMMLFFAFALAVPDYLVDDSWLTHMRRMPILAARNIWAALPKQLPDIKSLKSRLPKLRRKP